MNTCIIHLGATPIHVTHKPIRHMYLRVNRARVTVSLSVPTGTSMEDVRHFVESREAWIALQLARCIPDAPLPDGHIRHLGAVVSIEALCGPTPSRGRAAVVQALERRVLLEQLESYMAPWQERLGVRAEGFRVRRMKSRWGSCQIYKQILCFNAALVQYPPECIEYVVVHELAHLRVPGHGPLFWAIVESALPDWRERRKILNKK